MAIGFFLSRSRFRVLTAGLGSFLCWLPVHSLQGAELLGYWNFDNQANPGLELSGNAPDLTLSVAANPTASGGGVSGQSGDRAVDFGAVSNGGWARTVAGGHFDVISSTSAYSIVLWQFNRQVANTSTFWFHAPASPSNQRGIQAHIPWGNGTIYYDQSGCCGSTERLTVGGRVILNTWQHFVFQRDAAGNREIWVDGVRVASSGGAAPLEPLDGIVTIGAEGPTGSNSLNGLVDDFAVFDGPLSSAEISTLAAGGSPFDLVVDSDGDGMPDSYEDANGLNKSVNDAGGDLDNDGLNNLAEFTAKTDPQNPDSDGDSINDGPEVAAGTDPRDPDTDRDGLDDGAEVSGGTDPLKADSDGDGLDDGPELLAGTDPLVSDTDGDGSSDGQEVAYGTDPLDPADVPGAISEFTAAVGRFVEVVKNNTTDTQLHISEIEVFQFGVIADQADADGTSGNDLVQAGTPGVEIPPTTTQLEHGLATRVHDGDLESGAEVWTTDAGLGVKPRYMLDLGATRSIGEVRVWGRNDTCCANRLENFTVNVYEDDGSGFPGTLVNSALFPGVAPAATIGPAVLNLALPDPGIRSFMVDHPVIVAGEALLFSWEVNANATQVVIDQGVGDVTAQTDANGVGSALVNPGPGSDTTYTLTIIRPTGTATAAVTVSVTDRPIIRLFEADLGVVAPSAPVELRWEVANATSLALNGTDVLGTTSRVVRPTATTSYELVARNPNGSTSMTTRIRVLLPDEPVISEFMADNRGDVTVDEDGDSSDWIEICNPTSGSISLNGYYLTDDPTKLTKWRFPNVTIPPHGYLVLFASGKDRRDPASELHTSFALQDAGEYLGLVKPNGVQVVVDFWPEFPRQRAEISYGFDEEGVAEGYFLTPTPGAANGSSFDGFVGDTSFSRDRGFYDAPFQVEITTTEPGAEIRYTVDGTKPTATSGLVYSGPILITKTTVLRAAGFKSGFIPTDVDTQTYLFTSDIIAQPAMRTSITQDPVYGPQMDASLKAVPSLSLVFSGEIERIEKECSVEFINFEAGNVQHDVGMSRFGNYVTNFAKRGMRLAFRSDYGASKLRFPVFEGHDYKTPPAGEVDALDLRSGNHDMRQRGAYMSNRFTDDTMDAMGNIAPHGRFVHVYINGSYWGQYHMRERWNAAMLAEYFPGRKEDYEAVNANNNGNDFLSGTVTDGSGVYWSQTRSRVAGPSPFSNSRSHLDVANVIDFMLLWVSGNSESEFRSAGSVPMGVPFKFFMKDADGFLRSPGHSVTHQGPLSAMATFAAEGDPDYRILLADRIHKHFFNDGAFTPAKNISRLQARVDEIETSFIAESARWNERTPSSWRSYQTNLMSNHFPGLTQTMIDRFRSAGMYPSVVAPMFNQHGGSIQAGFSLGISAPAGTIYYTLDGSDPRLSETSGNADPPLTLVNEDALKRVYVPQDASDGFADGSGTSWRETGFNDAGWVSGSGGVGYENNNGYQAYFDIDVGASMSGSRTSCLIRIPFTIGAGSLDGVDALELKMRYDDAFVAYLNGVEVGRRLFTGQPDGNSAADSGHSDGAAVIFESLDISSHLGLLQEGDNVLAIHGLNHGAGSSDFLISTELVGRDIPLSSVEVSPTAVEYTGTVSLNQATTVKARVLSASGWSALNEATFVVDSAGLVVSEFMYNPSSATPGEIAAGFNDSEDFEFLELLNTSDRVIDLTGLRLVDGITFDFSAGAITSLAPGERALLVEDLAAFEHRYGTGHPVAGQYGGKLSDEGELVRLEDVLDNLLIEFTYDNVLPWPEEAAGNGYSLALRAPDTNPDHDDPLSWQASGVEGGTPGQEDVLTFDYASWAAAYTTGAPEEDDDGDGLSNFNEFVRGTPPNDFSSSPFTAVALESINVGGVVEDYLVYTFTYSLRADVSRVVEWSVDLNTWGSGAGATEFLGTVFHGDGTATSKWRSVLPASLSDRQFMRAGFLMP